MQSISLAEYQNIVFFIGAGMSAESGMPTYRGHGGIWSQYNYEEYACQTAFDGDPNKVLDFHQLRREKALSCTPHAGHRHLQDLQKQFPQLKVVTQNIDGLLQRAGLDVAAELHGSLWHMRCQTHGVRPDHAQAQYTRRRCETCGTFLRPDITWFGDLVNREVFNITDALVRTADLFVSVGTSGLVWPAAGFAEAARARGARMVELNLQDNEASALYDTRLRAPASEGIAKIFPLPPK